MSLTIVILSRATFSHVKVTDPNGVTKLTKTFSVAKLQEVGTRRPSCKLLTQQEPKSARLASIAPSIELNQGTRKTIELGCCTDCNENRRAQQISERDITYRFRSRRMLHARQTCISKVYLAS